MKISLIKGQKYDVTDTFGMSIYHDSEYLGEIVSADLWMRSPTHPYAQGPILLFKCQSEYHPNGFYVAVYINVYKCHGVDIGIEFRGAGSWYGDSVEEVLEKICGPRFKVT